MKKSIVITLFLLSILMIGAVSASENVTNEISTSDVTDDSISQNDNNLEISQTDNVKTTDDNLNKLESSETINKKSILKENNGESEIHKYYTTKNAKKENNLILDDGEAEEPLFIMETKIYSKLNNKDSTLLEIYEYSYYGIENGNISIYVNNEPTPRKIYTITNYEFDNKEHYSEDMGYYLDVTLNDLNIIQYGVYSIKVIGKDERSESEINLLETEIIYSPVQVYIHHEFTDYDTLIGNFVAESFNGENGTLKFYVNNDTIPRITYDIINGKFSNGNDTKEITLNDLSSYSYILSNITARFQLKNSDNEIELIKCSIIHEQLGLTYTVLTLKTNETIKKSDETFTFEARLKINRKIGKGKDIIFTINGMSCIARTNGTGIAKVILSSIGLQQIRESIPTDNKIKCKITFGDYVDIKYVNVESDTNNQPDTRPNPNNPDAGNNGNNNQPDSTPNPTTGSTNTISNTQTNKETIKLIASKKTFKIKIKIKKYTVTLKNKNKPIKKATVKLTVKGKKYTVRTNNKGKATFKITNLKKKGKYTAVITYKKIKRTVKIIVK